MLCFQLIMMPASGAFVCDIDHRAASNRGPDE